MTGRDAIVVGAGPNGLAAAVTLARAGLAVTLYEMQPTVGGGARTAEVTLPGFSHDICSAVHPMALASEFFQRFALSERLEFVTPEISYAHPLDGGRAAIAYRDLERTVAGLQRDGPPWRRLMEPLLRHREQLAEVTGAALLRVPPHPLAAVILGLRVLEQGSPAWNLRWQTELAPALLSGVMAHAIQPMPSLGSAAAGLVLAMSAHAGGWPIPVGGSQRIMDVLAADFRALGGEIILDHTVRSLRELPPARAVLLDVTPKALAAIAGNRLPDRYRRRLLRYRYGNAAAKVDFALAGPVPWRHPELALAGTLHLGGTRAELAEAENAVAAGRHPRRPYVLVSQPSQFDPTRAPAGQQAVWAYTHVPRGSTVDPTTAVSAQIERFAPGFQDLILGSRSLTAAQLAEYNPNYVAGDIASGAGSVAGLIARPVLSTEPWRIPSRGLYLCSAATPPGPGVHGLAGWNAAKSALRHEFDLPAPALSERKP